MKWFKAEYEHRSNSWGHVVQLVENPEHKAEQFVNVIIDPYEIEEVLNWTNDNSNARRISYDTWQFKSANEANQFIMIYNLRWT
jgi:hypothetical protein